MCVCVVNVHNDAKVNIENKTSNISHPCLRYIEANKCREKQYATVVSSSSENSVIGSLLGFGVSGYWENSAIGTKRPRQGPCGIMEPAMWNMKRFNPAISQTCFHMGQRIRRMPIINMLSSLVLL